MATRQRPALLRADTLERDAQVEGLTPDEIREVRRIAARMARVQKRGFRIGAKIGGREYVIEMPETADAPEKHYTEAVDLDTGAPRRVRH